MTTSKASTKKTNAKGKSKAPATPGLVAGAFAPGTHRAMTFELMQDGKARTAEQIVTGIKASDNLKNRVVADRPMTAREFIIMKIRDIRKLGFDISEEDGKFTMRKKRSQK